MLRKSEENVLNRISKFLQWKCFSMALTVALMITSLPLPTAFHVYCMISLLCRHFVWRSLFYERCVMSVYKMMPPSDLRQPWNSTPRKSSPRGVDLHISVCAHNMETDRLDHQPGRNVLVKNSMIDMHFYRNDACYSRSNGYSVQ